MEIQKADFDGVPTLDNFKDLYDKEFHKPIRINHKSAKFHFRNGSIYGPFLHIRKEQTGPVLYSYFLPLYYIFIPENEPEIHLIPKFDDLKNETILKKSKYSDLIEWYQRLINAQHKFEELLSSFHCFKHNSDVVTLISDPSAKSSNMDVQIVLTQDALLLYKEKPYSFSIDPNLKWKDGTFAATALETEWLSPEEAYRSFVIYKAQRSRIVLLAPDIKTMELHLLQIEAVRQISLRGGFIYSETSKQVSVLNMPTLPTTIEYLFSESDSSDDHHGKHHDEHHDDPK